MIKEPVLSTNEYKLADYSGCKYNPNILPAGIHYTDMYNSSPWYKSTWKDVQYELRQILVKANIETIDQIIAMFKSGEGQFKEVDKISLYSRKHIYMWLLGVGSGTPSNNVVSKAFVDELKSIRASKTRNRL